MNKILLHTEGFIVFVLSIYFYASFDFSWLLFFILLLSPDIAMLGYLINKKIGAIVYNLFHTYTTSLAVILFGFLFSFPILLAIGLIWTAHIGMDRMVGYGLKYPTSFKENHLHRV